ncbi:MAG: ADP-forming succinate--CoA ligase subunit beta [Chloroflexi bacterium]|nr:ADP-forming succinate--CoA ligase subunit beta [Chloroflexota bacterium]
MKLFEYQSKVLFSKYGIPIPGGRVADSVDESKKIGHELGGKVVIKAQVLTGGRGKAGGIRIAKNIMEIEEFSRQILGMEINGLIIKKVLVEEAVSIAKEIYLSISNDRNTSKPLLMASSAGGIDIEEVALKTPEKILKKTIDPLLGLRDYQLRDIAISIDLDRKYWKDFGDIVKGLWRLYVESDATLAEINPLAITSDDSLLAVDAKIIIDDNAIFRQPALVKLQDQDIESSPESEGEKFGVTFIKMKGNIGCLVNGAGLAMATMDILKILGGEAANFLDIGGGADAEKVEASIRLILKDPEVKAILINVFGGITRCDEVAKGLIKAVHEVKPEVPIIVRLAGTNDEEGMRMLESLDLFPAESLIAAASLAVKKATGGNG